ncbi:MAG: DUF6473 family protein [Microcoleaceae cyanobacterium]
MGIGYQRRDLEIVDYQLYPLRIPSQDRTYILRGPEIEQEYVSRNEFFTSVGAAFTFGCYCEKTYTDLMSQRLDLPALNFGFSGAGPLFFVENKPLIDYINRSKFSIILVMSGRSESNSLFDSHGKEMYTRKVDGKQIAASLAYQDLIEHQSEQYVRQIIDETRNNYIENYHKLFSMIEVPKILFWFSEREPEYQENYQDANELFSKFPHLINREVLNEIVPLADKYVECITRKGMPQKLISRFTGKPTATIGRNDLGGQKRKYNSYYASPEMHEDAANVLAEACKSFI